MSRVELSPLWDRPAGEMRMSVSASDAGQVCIEICDTGEGLTRA